MTVEEIRARIAEIAAKKSDNAKAHCLQDRLLFDVLRAISEGEENAESLAYCALAVENVEFSRWYA